MNMNLIDFKRLLIFTLIALILASLWSCIAQKQAALSDKQLFDLVKIGMSRIEAEKLLGKPEFEVGGKFYYGKPPKIETWQSPQAFASISVVYSAENIVKSKRFYGAK